MSDFSIERSDVPAAISDSKWAPRAGVALYVLMSAVAIVFIVPLIWPIVRSFQPGVAVIQPPSASTFRDFTFSNYTQLITGSAQILVHVGNSAIVTVGAVLVTGALATLAGYGFGRFQFPAKNIMFLMILATLMIPFQAILTPMFLELHLLGLTNSLVGLILTYTTFNLPFAIFIMRNSFQQVPIEIEESARVDGASSLTLLVRVLMPLVVPGLVTVCIFTFLFSWTEFLAALSFITTDSLVTLPVALLNIETGTYGQVNYAALEAGAVISMIPTVVLYVALQRYYVAGFTSGAVKG